MNVNVPGGTNAGWRNPFRGNALQWQCECVVIVRTPIFTAGPGQVRKTNPGYLNRCPDCHARRPT